MNPLQFLFGVFYHTHGSVHVYICQAKDGETKGNHIEKMLPRRSSRVPRPQGSTASAGATAPKQYMLELGQHRLISILRQCYAHPLVREDPVTGCTVRGCEQGVCLKSRLRQDSRGLFSLRPSCLAVLKARTFRGDSLACVCCDRRLPLVFSSKY